MDIVINQKFAVQNGLNVSEILVYSLLKNFNNTMSINDLVYYLEIQNEASIKRSVKSLIVKDLIVSERILDPRFKGIVFYSIKK